MNDIAIQVEGLSKLYHIGGPQKTYDTLVDQVTDMLMAPVRRAGKLVRGQATGAAELDDTIWALKDVSLEIMHGEIVGIIGRNGAGKSTLLKILSQITEPTEGRAVIYGRVGSLLEVGTGFHPELTGRENIFLNGAILGMRKVEIQRKFDEIVEFAEISKFIDTPVKHYSSGMYVRLAFAVAAHLEPEILLVDEVLAVGDVAFQKKCLGKMDDVAQEGRTVLFVSHNLSLMQTLCRRGIYLQDGVVRVNGSIGEAVDSYLTTLAQAVSQDLSLRTDRRGVGHTKLIGAEVSDGRNGSTSTLKTGSCARFTFRVNKLLPGMACTFSIYDSLGQPVTTFQSKVRGPHDITTPDHGSTFVCEIDELLLLPGSYRVDVAIVGDNRLQDSIQAATTFDVAEGHIAGRPAHSDNRFKLSIPHRWTLPAHD